MVTDGIANPGHEPIAFVLSRPGRSWFVGRAKPPAGQQLYLAEPGSGVVSQLTRVRWHDVGAQQYVVAVAPGPRRLLLTYIGGYSLLGENWCVTVAIRLRIVDFPLFYKSLGRDLLAAEQPITDHILAQLLRVRSHVVLLDALQGIQPDRVHLDLAPAWWEHKIDELAATHGLAISVEQVETDNAPLTAKANADAEARLDADVAARQLRQHQVDAERQMTAAKFKQMRDEIRHDAGLSESRRRFELAHLERNHMIETLRQDLEIRKLQAEIARVGRDLHQDERAAVQVQQDLGTETARLETKADELRQRIQAIPSDLLAKVNEAGSSGSARVELRDRFDVPAAAIERLAQDGDAPGAELLDLLLTQMRHQPHSLHASMIAARPARDATAHKTIDRIRIHDPLAMTVCGSREGYVSLLNFGTSGRVWLLIPNRFVMASDCRITSIAAPSPIPNNRWMPLQAHGYEFREEGPHGWERLAVLRTDTLLWTPQRLAGLMQVGPCFYELDGSAYEDLLEALATLPADTWSAAVTAFEVV